MSGDGSPPSRAPASPGRAAFDALIEPGRLMRGGRIAADWLPEDRFRYVDAFSAGGTIREFDPRSREVRTGAPEPQDGIPVAPGTFLRPSYFGFDIETPEVASPDGKWFAGLVDGNIRLRSACSGETVRLTEDASPANGWDIESTRFGVAAGATIVSRRLPAWSPDGSKLFATRFDRRRCGAIFRHDMLARPDNCTETPWLRAGEPIPDILPHIVDIESRRTVRIDVEVEDRLLLPVGWTSRGDRICFVQFARDMSVAEVVMADASTGRAKILLHERSDTFLRLTHDVIAGRSGCVLLPGDFGFLWQSDRSGWSHLYRYDPDGRPVGQLTDGEWPVIEVVGFDPECGAVYFTAHHDLARPYDVHLCRVGIGGGPVVRLTEGPGVHDIQMAPGLSCFVDTVSRPGTPPLSVVRASDGTCLHRFEPMDIAPLEAAGWTAPEEFCVKAADGKTDLWGILYRPRDFDPSRRYPVIEFIYGGPQLALVSHGFIGSGSGRWALPHALAQLGYVSVVVDARGTPERSKVFQDATYREWRRHMTADHSAALRNLAADRPWMDLGRVGIWGHSWGGYSVVACMLDAPGLYRAGVSSAPGYDPFESFLYEPFFGGPPAPDNRGAYDDALLLDEAAALSGELMIVAGSSDPGVWHDAVRMSSALIAAGKSHEFVMLPGQGHGYDELHARYFIDKLVAHFDRHLVDAAGGEEP